MTDRITIQLFEPVQAWSVLRDQVWPWAKAHPKCAGVYIIRCLANGRYYIGSSENIAERISRHFTLLRGGRHENGKVQRHFDKYGEGSFACELLEIAEGAALLKSEQRWLDLCWGPLILNIQRCAGRPPTFAELPPHVRERKRELHRKSSTGRPASQKLLDMLSLRTGPNSPLYGTKWSDEKVERYRFSMSGEKNPNFGKTGEKSPLFGVPKSASTRALMSANSAWKGRTGSAHPQSLPCRRIGPDGAISEYGGVLEASRALGLATSTVSRWCRGVRRPKDGARWEYAS